MYGKYRQLARILVGDEAQCYQGLWLGLLGCSLLQGCATTTLWSTTDAVYRTEREAAIKVVVSSHGDFENSRTEVWLDYTRQSTALHHAVRDVAFITQFPTIYHAQSERRDDSERRGFKPVWGPIATRLQDAYVILGVDTARQQSWATVELRYRWPAYSISFVPTGMLDYPARSLAQIPAAQKKLAAGYRLYAEDFGAAIAAQWAQFAGTAHVPIDADKAIIWQEAAGALSDLVEETRDYRAMLISLTANDYQLAFIKISFDPDADATGTTAQADTHLLTFVVAADYGEPAVISSYPDQGWIPARLLVTRRESEYVFPAPARVLLSPVSMALDYYTLPLQLFFMFSIWSD